MRESAERSHGQDSSRRRRSKRNKESGQWSEIIASLVRGGFDLEQIREMPFRQFLSMHEEQERYEANQLADLIIGVNNAMSDDTQKVNAFVRKLRGQKAQHIILDGRDPSARR